MKHIKLLLASSLLVLGFFSLKAQTFFLDSAVYYVHKGAPSLTPGLDFNTHFKELLLFDSVGHFGEYYTVERTPGKYNFLDSLTYKLRVFENRVYYTGYIITDNEDTFETEELMIYDFNLSIGDTLKVSENLSGLKYELILDRITQMVFDDGVTRDSYSWKVIDPNYELKGSSGVGEFKIYKGLGSNYFGLVGFELTQRRTHYHGLISICKNNIPIYINPDSYYAMIDHCNEDSIQAKIDEIRSVSVPIINFKRLKIFPNPVESTVFIDDIKNEEFEIRDQLGKTVLKGYFENKIDVERLKTGIYQLVIKTNHITYTAKIVKL